MAHGSYLKKSKLVAILLWVLCTPLYSCAIIETSNRKSNANLLEIAPPVLYGGEDSTLLKKIKHDLNLDNRPVKVSFGDYDDAEIRRADNGGFVICINIDLYEILTYEEKIALIAHEMGHINRHRTFYGTFRYSQIEADRFATRYSGIEAMISLLDKFCPTPICRQTEWYKTRHNALVRLK